MAYYLKIIMLNCAISTLFHEDDENSLVAWKESLHAEGITVYACLRDGRNVLMPKDGEVPALNGQEAVLWILDDEKELRRHAQAGDPVMALLSDEGMGGDSAIMTTEVKYACLHLCELDADYLDKVYRRYRGIPWDILETERCFLRETTESDVDAFYEIYAEPSITAHMEDLYPNREDELAYTRDYVRNVYEFYGHGVWTVCLRETGEVIGRAGLSYREGYEDPELGFVIGVPWQGQGLATEVCEAILRFGERELDFARVIAFVEPGNLVSIHLLQKLGFCMMEEVELGGKKHVLCRRG